MSSYPIPHGQAESEAAAKKIPRVDASDDGRRSISGPLDASDLHAGFEKPSKPGPALSLDELAPKMP